MHILLDMTRYIYDTFYSLLRWFTWCDLLALPREIILKYKHFICYTTFEKLFEIVIVKSLTIYLKKNYFIKLCW